MLQSNKKLNFYQFYVLNGYLHLLKSIKLLHVTSLTYILSFYMLSVVFKLFINKIFHKHCENYSKLANNRGLFVKL